MRIGRRLIITRRKVGESTTFRARTAHLFYIPLTDILVIWISRLWRDEVTTE